MNLEEINLQNGNTVSLKAYLSNNKGLNRITDVEWNLIILASILFDNLLKFDGLPDTIPSFLITRAIFWRGSAVLFKPTGSEDFMLLPAAWNGTLNDYGQPVKAKPISLSGKVYEDVNLVPEYKVGKDKKADISKPASGVLIRSNYLGVPVYSLIMKFISQSAFTLDSKEINAILSRVPVILKGTKGTKKALIAEFNKIFGSNKNPVKVVYDENADFSSILDKVDLGITYEPEKYWVDFNNSWNMICKFLGVRSNNASQKQSGVTDSEIHGSDSETDLYREGIIRELQRSFDLAAKTLGIKEVKVSYNEIITSSYIQQPKQQPKGGEE